MNKSTPIILAVLAAGTTPIWFWNPFQSAPVVGQQQVQAPATFDRRAAPDGNPLSAVNIIGLRVAVYNEAMSQTESIEVKKEGGAWVIPSHFSYPADGNTQVSRIAANMLGLQRGRLVDADPKKHGEYQVLDPLKEENLIRKGEVGKRVTLRELAGDEVVDLIIGKYVEGGEGLYYVRDARSDEVWTAKAESWLPTKFIEYVEPDPFKIKKDDVRLLSVADYQIDEARGTVESRNSTRFERTGSDQDWSAPGSPEGKRPGKATLDSLLTELGSLRLAGVRPFERIWLESRGFFPAPNEFIKALGEDAGIRVASSQGSAFLIGKEGCLTVGTRDGLLYKFFFGDAALDDDSDKDPNRPRSATAAGSATAGQPTEQQKKGASRYLAVFVTYNEKADEEARSATAAEPAGKQAKKKGGLERARKAQERFTRFFYVLTDDSFKKLRPAFESLWEDKPKEPMAGNTGKTNKAWLEENGKRTGVTTTASGLQYEVLASGPVDGTSPVDGDSVEMKYKGTLVDGEEFDATKGDATATFGVNGVIKAWTEALKLMKPGDKWKIYVPPELGYGEAGSPPKIGVNAILIFEMEMVKVVGK